MKNIDSMCILGDPKLFLAHFVYHGSLYANEETYIHDFKPNFYFLFALNYGAHFLKVLYIHFNICLDIESLKSVLVQYLFT